MIRVRLFAAAAEAAGVAELEVEAVTAGDLRNRLGSRSATAPGVIGQCALLRDGDRLDDGAQLAAGDLVDVLPPFAGG